MKTKQTILVVLALLVSTIAFSQVGIGTPTPNAKSILELESTTKGFLPPRLTNGERDAITSPASGLTIYNTTESCLQWWNGSFWHDGCSNRESGIVDPVTGGETDNAFQNNTLCTEKLISVSPCAGVAGATLNDDPTTADGIEYNWNGAVDFVSGGSNQALVEIGGQCWYKRNAINVPSAYNPVPTWVNSTDVGWSGFYNGLATETAPGEGRLYQWSAAMNGATGAAAERAQGICPAGFHVPSDCEWMYLEHSLGMSVNDQQLNNNNRGTEGRKLSTLVLAPATNSSGFTALIVGYRRTLSEFGFRGTDVNVWTSTSLNSNAQTHGFNKDFAGVKRNSLTKILANPVRCLRD